MLLRHMPVATDYRVLDIGQDGIEPMKVGILRDFVRAIADPLTTILHEASIKHPYLDQTLEVSGHGVYRDLSSRCCPIGL